MILIMYILEKNHFLAICEGSEMIIDFEQLPDIRSAHKDEIIIFCGGCFDLLHIGHTRYLEKCRQLGDILVVATSSDNRVKERKGKGRPIIPERDRAEMLHSLSCVSYALVAPEMNSAHVPPTIQIIHSLKPDIFASSDDRMARYVSEVVQIGIISRHIPENRLESTSDIIRRAHESFS